MGKHRIEFVDLAGNQLRPGTREFLGGHPLLDDACDLTAEPTLQFGTGLALARRTQQVEQAGTTRRGVISGVGADCEPLFADQAARKARRVVPVKDC